MYYPLPEKHIEQLQELGYSKDDCVKALKTANDNIDTAGVWLLDNAKVVKRKEDNKLTAIVVSSVGAIISSLKITCIL